ncbi:Thiamine-triphosphatase [Gracilaria domingensis]|nr:Thiamine-triphosphatase [Gracilaria domingensis]
MWAFLPATRPFLSRQTFGPRCINSVSILGSSASKCTRRLNFSRWICAQAKPDLIEVESRFRASPQAREALNMFAGDCKQVRFRDRYYCEQLALLDKWLRRREDQWELKIPVELGSRSQRGAVVYKELVGSAALQHIGQLGLSTSAMQVYASITTVRSIWAFESRLPWGNYQMHITADECFADDGFQYSIGEIEVLVARDEQVDGAAQAVEHTCRQLELEKIDNSGGKLMRYLYENNSKLFRKLKDSGVV